EAVATWRPAAVDRVRPPESASVGPAAAGTMWAMDAPTPGPAAAAPTRFDTDTAVTPLGDGRYRARMDKSWWIIAGPNGGYVAATILRAVLAEVAEKAPAEGAERRARSATFHYLRPPQEGEVEVEVTLDR